MKYQKLHLAAFWREVRVFLSLFIWEREENRPISWLTPQQLLLARPGLGVVNSVLVSHTGSRSPAASHPCCPLMPAWQGAGIQSWSWELNPDTLTWYRSIVARILTSKINVHPWVFLAAPLLMYITFAWLTMIPNSASSRLTKTVSNTHVCHAGSGSPTKVRQELADPRARFWMVFCQRLGRFWWISVPTVIQATVIVYLE